MRIALATVEFINNDLDYNINQIRKYMIKAKTKEVDLICFGESFLQGFDALTWKYDIDKNIALSQDSLTMEKLKGFTKEIDIDLLVGYIELDNYTIYSSYALISNGKIIHNHRRIAEGWKDYSKTDNHYQEGTCVKVVEYKEHKIVFALCGELWEYPERFKIGEDILIWGIYCNYSIDEWKSEEMEYAKFASGICHNVAIVNSISHNIDSYGGAWFIKDGEVHNKVPFEKEAMLIISL